MAVVSAFNLIGDSVRDAMDPKHLRGTPPRKDKGGIAVVNPLLRVRDLCVRRSGRTAARRPW
jgi:hypothetical protein